jgi:ectoine hydroxylase-related dioxygenase (phytanoyl-CoA dioxygenase family)
MAKEGSAWTAVARRQWEEQGYLLLEQVLSPGEVAQALVATDAVLAGSGEGVFSQQSGAPGEATRAFKVAQVISRTDALDFLTDHPGVLPCLLDFLGPYLQILGTEVFVRRPGPGEAPLVEWHTDGGPALGQLLASPGFPALQLKAQFFLTDLTEPDSGNFMLVPGSHRRPFLRDGSLTAALPGAVQLRVKAGDVLLFPWSLWHAVAPNRSGRVRKSITVRYGPLWSRPYDYERLPSEVLARMTPRRRRLFGDLGESAHPSSYFYPDPVEQLRLMRGDEGRTAP